MGLFENFPYTNFHELNLDWILRMLQKIDKTMDEFVAINALKYADPIQWNITSQYEKNTIVIDPQSGTAYISVQPVPVGVALTNTDYWTVVFDLEQFVTKANGNFTLRVEPLTTLTATFPTNEGQWLVWGGDLYEALVNIVAGDQYVPDSNIKRITVEEAINTVKASITQVSNDLAAEVVARGNADNTLQGNINAEALARGNADNTLQGKIDAAVLALSNRIDDVVNKVISINVLSLGVVNDASADSSSILNSYIADHDNITLYFPDGRYLFNSTITLTGKKINFIGQSEFETILIYNGNGNLFEEINPTINDFLLTDHNHKEISNFTLRVPNGTCFYYYAVNQRIFKNIHFDDCLNGFHIKGSDGIYISNILQNGSIYNTWEFGGNVGGSWLFNWNSIVENWVAEANDTPRTIQPWFKLSGCVGILFNNITTHGRLETVAFDIIGHNEGTFFTNVVLVCPTWGIICEPDPNDATVLPACVECNNFSIDQPYVGGVLIRGQWFMMDNFSIVNGNQRNNTQPAILAQNATEVWLSNGTIYNWNEVGINLGNDGDCDRASINGVVVHDITGRGIAYINNAQTYINPLLSNNHFEGSVIVPQLSGVDSMGNSTKTIRSVGVIPATITAAGQILDTITIPEEVYNNCTKINFKFQLNPDSNFDGLINIGGSNLITLPTIAANTRCSIEINMCKSSGEWFGATTIINNNVTSVESGNVVSGDHPLVTIASGSTNSGNIHIVNYQIEVS